MESFLSPQRAIWFYLVEEEFEKKISLLSKIKTMFKTNDLSKVYSIRIHRWQIESDDETPDDIIDYIIEYKDKLPKLSRFNIGYIDAREIQIHNIVQTDYTRVLQAFPQLESLQIRGTKKLAFSNAVHDNLKELSLESGGLQLNTIQNLAQARFPNLMKLAIGFGLDYDTDKEYCDYTINDLLPIFSKDQFPELLWLGLTGCCHTDEIVTALLDSPLPDRLIVLDLSGGTLTDKGGTALLQNKKIQKLKLLNISGNFISQDLIEKFDGKEIKILAYNQKAD